MDPITLIILCVVLLSGASVGAVSVSRKKRKRSLRLMRDAIRSSSVAVDKRTITIFDVFWDLGVSEFALAIMSSQRLLMRDIQDLAMTLDALEDRVRESGSYNGFIQDNLDAIQEHYNEHRSAGNRRQIPALMAKTHKTLPVPAVVADKSSSNPGNLPVPYSTDRNLAIRPPSAPGHRLMARNDALLLKYDTESFEIDLDDVTRVDPIQMAKSVLFGTSAELDKWWKLRTLRGLKEELNTELTHLYKLYATQAQADPAFYNHLYDATNRWDIEARRIGELLQPSATSRRAWKQLDGALCAEALLMEAQVVARQLSYQTKRNVDQTLELIHQHARSGNTSMSGFLVFMNHHAIFSGRGKAHSERIRRIETTTYKIQTELRTLTDDRTI